MEFQIQIQPQQNMYFLRPQSQNSYNKEQNTSPINPSNQPNMKSPLSHQQSTPLSINKTHQSNFYFYQQGLQLNSQNQLPNLSPLSDHRPLTKSFTPYPMWYTTQEGKGWKIREDSFAVFDDLNDEQSDKENAFCGVNEEGKLRKAKEGSQDFTPKSYSIPFTQEHQNISQSKSNGKNWHLTQSNLSNNSDQMKRSTQRKLNCSNIKTTLDLPDSLPLPTSIDSHFVSLDNMLSRQSQQNQKHQIYNNQPLIHIQQPSLSSYSPSANNIIYSSHQSGIVGNVQMVLSQLPHENEHENSLSMDESSKYSNEIIDYFLTEQDDQRQSCSMSQDLLVDPKSQMDYIMSNCNHQIKDASTKDKPLLCNQPEQTSTESTLMQKVQNNHIDYCSILQTKIKQLSSNIAILHEKVLSGGSKSHQTINNQSLGDQNKLYPATMESLDSRHVNDSRNIATINNHMQPQWEKFSNKKKMNKLIYHDSKVIFSQNDSGFEDFSEEFSQVLTNKNNLSDSNKMNKSLRSQSNVRIIVHNQNSPLSIDLQQQMDRVLGRGSGKSERVNNSVEKVYNLFGKPQLQQDIVIEDDFYFSNSNTNISLSSSAPIQKQSFRLSLPKLYTQNQEQMSCSHSPSSPKMKSHQSFISQSSNQTFIQQQISNKKFNKKFNEWLMMS